MSGFFKAAMFEYYYCKIVIIKSNIIIQHLLCQESYIFYQQMSEILISDHTFMHKEEKKEKEGAAITKCKHQRYDQSD